MAISKAWKLPKSKFKMAIMKYSPCCQNWFHGKSSVEKFWISILCKVWKNERFTLTGKVFRQIDYLRISLANLLLSRNFCQKSVSKFPWMWKLSNFTFKILWNWRMCSTKLQVIFTKYRIFFTHCVYGWKKLIII